jgi:hypothetical protein
MSPSDRTNPFARQDAWPRQTAEPVHIGPPKAPPPEPVPLQPRPLSRNSIFSGSAVPMGPIAATTPEPTPPPRPSIEQPPPGEARPPLRTATFVAPAPPRRRSFRRHVPLIGSLMTAAAGFAVLAFVMTRPPPQLVVPPAHRPTHLAVVRAGDPAPAPPAEAPGPQPTLRGLMQRFAPARRPTPTALQPAAAPSAPAAAVAAPQPRFSPPPAPDPDAPIATRPPYS